MTTKDKNAVRSFHNLTPPEQARRQAEFLVLLRQHNPKATDAQISAAMKRALASMGGQRPCP